MEIFVDDDFVFIMDPEDDPSTKSDGKSCGGLRHELKECMLKSDCVIKV